MSAWSREALTKSLGEESDEEMIREGTSPDMRNFGELSLTPAGINIQFQPYQVGPWSAGPQQVEMPLEALASAGPEPAVWPDAAKDATKPDAARPTPAAAGAKKDDGSHRQRP